MLLEVGAVLSWGCGGVILMMEVVAVILGLWWCDTDVGGCGGDFWIVVVWY